MPRRVLMVEGSDDEHVVMHVCREHGIRIPDAFTIDNGRVDEHSDAGGVELLLDKVPVTLKTDVERLGVILDADEDAQHRWVQLRDRLCHAGFDGIPELPAAEGTSVDLDLQTRFVRLGVWIMPDNRLPGMLENFLAFLVPEDDVVLPHVDRFLAGIPSHHRPYSEKLLPKARIHAYLAVQEKPGKPLGLAITFRYLDAKKKEVVAPFMKWLRHVLIDD